MKIETFTLTLLIADEGKTLTNGEEYGKEIYLGANDSVDNWHAITDAEAAKSIPADDDREEV